MIHIPTQIAIYFVSNTTWNGQNGFVIFTSSIVIFTSSNCNTYQAVNAVR